MDTPTSLLPLMIRLANGQKRMLYRDTTGRFVSKAEYEQLKSISISEQKREDITQRVETTRTLGFGQIETISPGRLSGRIILPSRLTFSEFIDQVVSPLYAIEFVYSILAILSSGKQRAIQSLVQLLKEAGGQSSISVGLLFPLLADTSVEPLRLVSIHYGSDTSFDFLGFGKVLEIIRETVKDLTWRGKHEKQMADLDKKAKELEIEKQRVEIATQALSAVEKVANLNLPEDYRQIVITALVPQLASVANTTGVAIIDSRSAPLLPRREVPKQ